MTDNPNPPDPSTAYPPPSYPCDQCERTFGTVQALGVHRYRSHDPAGKDWGKNRKKRNADRAAAAHAILSAPDLAPVVHRTNGNKPNTWRELTEFRLLTDDGGGIWIAERVR